MARFLLPILTCALLLAIVAPLAAVAEEEPATQQGLVSDEVAEEALARFKEDYKARGLKGEEKLLQRDYALSELASVQHPDVVAALAKVARSSDATLKTLAVIYLGEQREMPGLAGPAILKAIRRAGKDTTLLISGLQSLASLRYFGASDEVGDLLDHRDFAVKKAAIQTVGQMGEMRLWKEILQLVGVRVKDGGDVSGGNESSGKEEVVEEGYSYEGVEVTYDTGTSGDGDQRMAEKIGRAKLAANKAAATGGRGGGAGGGAAGGASGGGSGGVARNPRELVPFALATLERLTGESFANSKEVAAWVVENREAIRDRIALIDELEKAQIRDAKELK